MVFVSYGIACDTTDTKPNFATYAPDNTSTDEDVFFDGNHCQYIYLLERREEQIGYKSFLWKFDPVTTTMLELGPLECPFSGSDYLIAMTADQKGQLWFLSNQEFLFVSDPGTLQCTATGIEAFSNSLGLRSRSLAFMRPDPEAEDQLFFSSYTTQTSPNQGILSSLVNQQIQIVGEIPGFTGLESIMELAGNAKGQLFGQSFANSRPSRLLELNPYTGEILEEHDLGIPSGSAFTFALLDDTAWMFLSTGPNNVSELYRYQPDRHELEYVKTLSHTILGSAAPTCSDSDNGS